MKLIEALRCNNTSCAAFVGAGGKSSAMLQLAWEYPSPVIISASTHLAEEQVKQFHKHYIVETIEQLNKILINPIPEPLILTGSFTSDNRSHGLSIDLLEMIHKFSKKSGIPFLIEADGSRKLPLKAPASYEPAIPPWVDLVVVTAGLNALGQPIDLDHVHRPEVITKITGTKVGDLVTADIISNLLGNPYGGLKNIPEHADRKLLFNQVNTENRWEAAVKIADQLKDVYSSIVFADIPHWDHFLSDGYPSDPVIERREKIAGIILAAGRAERFGGPKILLDWGGIPVIRKIAMNALESGLSPVILVLGAYIREVLQVVNDLPVEIVVNADWEIGQSTSFQKGVHAVPDSAGGFIILLGDQPHITVEVINRLVQSHKVHASPIIIPVVGGKRANPVFFDTGTRNDIYKIVGDTGGRAIFKKFPLLELPFEDSGLTEDIDTLDDYRRMFSKYVSSRSAREG